MILILLIVVIILLIAIISILAFPTYDLLKGNYEVNKELAEWFKKSEITAGLEFNGKNFVLKTQDEVEKEEKSD